jgi:hypothetical protein
MATPTYTPIQTQTLGSAQTTVTFSSIPQTYTDLILVVDGATTSAGANITLQAGNGTVDTTSIYSARWLVGDGSSANSSSQSGQANALMGAMYSGRGNLTIHLMNYANTSTYKTFIGRTSTSANAVGAYVGLFRSTSAINIFTITAGGTTFIAGSTFTLYGIANAAIGAPKATGGIITYDNTYYYHTFGASGTFTPQQSLTADILCVAGGGGGGSGGGGGAGGLLGFASQSLTATGYTVTVGNGGAGAATAYVNGTNGGNSQFGALTASVGGGGGASVGNTNANSGGSGGGGTRGNYTAGTGTAGQGNNGANGIASGSTLSHGGGGGAGSQPSAPTTATGGNGGTGLTTYSAWSQATGTGFNTGYAGGGSGGGGTNGSGSGVFYGGTAVHGGGTGGNADYNSTGNCTVGGNGVVATGGGGGGGGSGAADKAGGNGGSGVVIIRYLKA